MKKVRPLVPELKETDTHVYAFSGDFTSLILASERKAG
jgi:hypothetical protein